jgi:hypothetical protein
MRPSTRLLGADEVLAAFAARQRQVAGAHQLVVGQPGEQARVLVVGMGGHIQHVPHHRQSIDAAQELGRRWLARRWARYGCCGEDRCGQHANENADQCIQESGHCTVQ